MIDNLVTAAGLACFLFGLFVFFSAVLGLFRFDYVLNRMHAAAVGDSLGIFCVLIGLMLLHGWSLSAAKTLLIFVFLWLTSPVCSHLVAEMEVSTVCYCSAAVQAAAGIGNRVYGAVPDDGGAVEPAPEPGSGHYGGGCGRRCDQHPLFPDAEEDPRAEGDTG